jgi:hypothetical protein
MCRLLRRSRREVTNQKEPARLRSRQMKAVLVAIVALAVSGCSLTEDKDEPPAAAKLRVHEALRHEPVNRASVTGFLFVQGGTARLCNGVLASSPPQCPRLRIRVRGSLPKLPMQRAGLLAWSSTEVTLTGKLRAGVLTLPNG